MKKYLQTSLLLLLLLPTLFLCGCGAEPGREQLQNEAAAYDGDTILIRGLGEEDDFELTVAQLMELEMVTKSVAADMADGTQVKVKITGPLLETLLQQYGRSQKDFTLVRFSAADKYSIAVPAEILKNQAIILGLVDRGRALTEDERPVRVVVPGERAMYWVRRLTCIDFETGATAALCRKIFFLETAAQSLPQEDYAYYESLDKVIKTRDLIGKYADIDDAALKNVFMHAGDGLYKNERTQDFLSGYLKITGQDTPRFLSPELPQGMHVRDLLHISYGDTAFFSLDQALQVFHAAANVPPGSVAYTDLVKQVGTVKANCCRLVAADGAALELENSRMAQAYFYPGEDGSVSFAAGSPGGPTLEGLLSLEFIE